MVSRYASLGGERRNRRLMEVGSICLTLQAQVPGNPSLHSLPASATRVQLTAKSAVRRWLTDDVNFDRFFFDVLVHMSFSLCGRAVIESLQQSSNGMPVE